MEMSDGREKRKVEFIESYWTGGEYGSNYQWNDNHGELIRCKDCEHSKSYSNGEMFGCEFGNGLREPDWFCADGVRKEC